MNYSNLKKIFELGRNIKEDSSNPYLHFGYKNQKSSYKIITSGELFIRGNMLDIPSYIYQFMNFHGEALMMANIINDKVISIVFRSLDHNKEFTKLGTIKSSFYGIGDLSKDFRFGLPLLLVEGHLDRDMMATIYPNTLGLMTNRISKTQLEVLTHLTDKFILMLDNDEAGIKGQRFIKYQLKDYNVKEFKHDCRLKDAGDLVKLEIQNKSLYDDVLYEYITQLNLLFA